MTTKLSRQNIKDIRAEMDRALGAIAKRFGLEEIKTGRISFTSESFTAKVEGRVEGGLTKEGRRYQQFQLVYKLPPMTEIFVYAGSQYRITGLNRPKTKILMTSIRTGKKWAFPVSTVQAQFGVSATDILEMTPAKRVARRGTPLATPEPPKGNGEFGAIEL